MEENKISSTSTELENRILTIRGKQVILDRDLAELYNVETKQLNRATKRNIDRFPERFMFQLTELELGYLRCQFGTSSFVLLIQSVET